MKTAIELLLNELEEYDFKVSPSIKKRYIEMEKKQMFGFTDHHHVIGEGTERFFKEAFEEYYNETFKK